MDETEAGIRKLLDQQVAVFKTDGFVKKGKLVGIYPNFIKLHFFNGTEELVPWIQISSVRIDG
jgi:hypothetical protein